MPASSSTTITSPPGLVKPSNKSTKDKAQMNQILSPTSPLFLPLTQLNPYCSRLLGLINDDKVSRKELVASELNLWREVKKLKALQDKASIFTYLIGYYHTILYQLVKLNDSDDLFQYHILIRLGDLNRYLDRLDIAEYYYCNARNLFPNYGHAFNQLGLLTRTDNFYKCCYYYARAAKSCKKPLNKNLAESNLRIVITEHEDSILNHISNDDSSLSNTKVTVTSTTGCLIPDDKSTQKVTFPSTSFEWFYIMVSSVYFDNILPIAKPFMSYMGENFSIQRAKILRGGVKIATINCDRDSYLLMASLDVLLDWSRLGSQGQQVCSKISNELRHMRSSLSSLIASLKSFRDKQNNSSDSVDTSESDPCTLETTLSAKPFSGPGNSTPLSPSTLNTSDELSSLSTRDLSDHLLKDEKPTALPHDCVLRGFKPLEIVHKDLRFPSELPVFNGTNGKLDEFGEDIILERSFIGPEQLMQLLNRIKSKIDSFGPMLKRRTRNIALESILSNMSSTCDSESLA